MQQELLLGDRAFPARSVLVAVSGCSGAGERTLSALGWAVGASNLHRFLLPRENRLTGDPSVSSLHCRCGGGIWDQEISVEILYLPLSYCCAFFFVVHRRRAGMYLCD